MRSKLWCPLYVDLPCLPASDWAAWVQALGTIAAVCIAVAVPLVLHRRERKQINEERALRARSYALALLPSLSDYLSRLKQARWRYKDLDDPDDFDFIAERLVVPEPLLAHQIHLHELSAVGGRVQDALAQVPRLRVLVNSWEFYLRYGGTYTEPDGTEHDITEPEEANVVFASVISRFELALSELEALFNPKPTDREPQ